MDAPSCSKLGIVVSFRHGDEVMGGRPPTFSGLGTARRVRLLIYAGGSDDDLEGARRPFRALVARRAHQWARLLSSRASAPTSARLSSP